MVADLKINNVISYYIKNFCYILLFAIVPAVFCGLFMRPFALFETLYQYPNLTIETFADLFLAVYSADWLYWVLSIVGILLLLIFISLFIGKVEAHFRTGKFDLSWHNVRGINYNLAGVTKTMLFVIVLNFVVNLLTLLLIYLMHFIFSINGVPTVAGTIVNWVIAVVALWLQARITTYFMFAGLDSIIMGSPYTVAMGNASHAIAKRGWDMFLAEIVPFVLAILLTVLGCWLDIVWLTNIVSILILFPYIVILGMVNFFDHYDIKRYDNRKYYLR